MVVLLTESAQSSLAITNFGTLDWCIVGFYLLGTVLIGLYANRFVTSISDFVVAGRSLNSCLSIATMIGSELGLITIMYSSQKGFGGGFAAFHIALAAGGMTLIVGMTGFIVVPLRELGVMTIPEYYEKRFSRGVRVFGGAILALAGILNMGLFLMAGSEFVVAVTGMNSSLHLNIVMTVMMVMVVSYTVLGGMVSVVITDYIQFVVLSIGLLVTCAFAFRKLGWVNIVESVHVHMGSAGFDPFHADGFGPTYVVWMIFTAGLVSCAVWQTAVMRACAASSTKVVRRLYMWSSLGFMIRLLIPYFLGICAFVYFVDAGDFQPGKGGDDTYSLTAMPRFLAILLPSGIIGIVVSGMLAAFMSTHDSYLLCWSAVITQDVVSPLTGDRITMQQRLALTRISIVAIGVFLLIWSLWYPLRQDMWDYMAVTGAIYFTGAFSVLLLGLYWSGASTTGAYLALLCGFGAILGLRPIQDMLGLNIGPETVGLVTVAASLAAMLIGSVVRPDPKPVHDRKLSA